jgi:hypothetical protein
VDLVFTEAADDVLAQSEFAGDKVVEDVEALVKVDVAGRAAANASSLDPAVVPEDKS